jgi:hypothetical protein
MMVKYWAAAFCAACAAVTQASAASAGVSEADGATREEKIVTSITFNFARFLQWDEAAQGAPGTNLVLCILDADASPAWNNINGKKIGDRAIEVKYFNTGASGAEGCDMAYVGGEFLKAVSLRAFADNGVVTISDAGRFLKSGGAIEMSVRNDRATFDVDSKTLDRAGARLSSKLMRVGMRVSVSGD